MGSYCYRSLIESLYIYIYILYRSLIEALYTLNSPPLVSVNAWDVYVGPGFPPTREKFRLLSNFGFRNPKP